MPVHILNLVAPLPHEGTAMRITDTAAREQAASSAVSSQIGLFDLLPGDVDSANVRRTTLTTPGRRTSTTATRTGTTRTTSSAFGQSADSTATPFPFVDLVKAYLDCRRHKRNSRSALLFEERLEFNLCRLYDELIAGTWQPGRTICFVITRPKPREVWAAAFRDRIVHHLLHNAIKDRFHASFIANSCACIPERGTLYAAERLEHSIRSVTQNWSQPAHYLKCDLANFFVAIRKDIVFEQLARKVTEPFWRELARRVLFHDPRDNVEVRGSHDLLRMVPPHKSLFNATANTGLPIGNLSSQFFANVHLDALDQYVKHQLKATRYVRYVDDFILLHESPQWLNAAHDRINAFLPARLGAHLNPRKTILQPVYRGIDFVGHVIKPWRRTTRPRTLDTAIQRVRRMPAEDVYQSANSYFGLLRQATHSHHDRTQLARAVMQRGHVMAGDFTKTFRKSA